MLRFTEGKVQMDAISKGIELYRLYIDDLPDDVLESELRAEVVPNLRHARNGDSIQSLILDIAIGLANRLELRNLNARACESLGQALAELAKA